MIHVYAKNGYNKEALAAFKNMLTEDITIDQHLLCSTFSACGPFKAYNTGKYFHSFITKLGFEQHVSVINALTDMYCKLGDMDSGSRFLNINSTGTNTITSIISYTSLIDGYVESDQIEKAFTIFIELKRQKVEPNEFTFSSLIKSCANHATLEQGVQLHALVLKHNLDQDPFVSSIIVDISGKLKETEIFIKNIPFEPNNYAWCSFLASCRKYNDKERGVLASKHLKILDPQNSGAHILLSNIYAKEQEWEHVRGVRKTMKDENVKNIRGCSWVDVDNKVHVFGVEDWCHEDKKEIDMKLDDLLKKIMEVGYVPDVGSVPVYLDDDMKVKILNHHSERIAIAYALISGKIGKPIIVKKNLRVCVDCDCAIKLISKVEGREIILRDNSRFHHFADGLCSYEKGKFDELVEDKGVKIVRKVRGEIRNDISMLTKHLQKHSNTVAHIIQTYAQSKQLSKGKLLHAQLITSGYPSCTYLTNHLLSMYARCGQLGYAHRLFDEMPQRNLVSWTAMISAFSQNSEFTKAIATFCEMYISGESPNQFAFSSVIQACSSLKSLQFGKQIHCLSLKVGFSYELFVGSNLADMYSKSDSIIDACMVFEEMPVKDEVSWNSMIHGYAKNGYNKEALAAFKNMLTEDITIDQHLLCSTFSACGPFKAYNTGKSLHSFITKLGFEQHVSVINALTDMYCKLGDMDSGSRFLNINSTGTNTSTSIISYTSLIDGYVESDQIEKAFTIFIELKRQKIEPNEFTFSSLIKSCANHATLEQGVQLHALVLKHNLDQDPFVSSIIVDMYGKCGLLDHSLQAFEKTSKRNEYTWNSIIGVFAHHGLGKEAIDVFNRMLINNIKPNTVTFINLLNACSHSGLLTEGLSYFESMETIYGVKPKSEHYSCVIDLMGRSGKLKETEIFIKNMPFEPNEYAWCSFLASCRKYNDKERGELASKHLKILDPQNSGAHVLLSNIYAKEQEWEHVRGVRKTMKDENVKKIRGCSWVDVDNKVHIFGVEDWCHEDKKEIDMKLDDLLKKIMEVGYVPDVGSVPVDLDDDTKVKILNHHSERIAIAYALIRGKIGKPIIVKKNLRVCVDCHCAIKLISKVEGREIILRDNSRFHHFVDGLCSCNDFW
ncbi:hypothetical protein LXL04_018330 [Taraxacum kok-saghyz]